MESEPPRREALEQLAEEFVDRYRRGERPALSEYVRRCPEHAEEIRDLFPALVMMEQIAPGSGSDEAAALEGSRRRRSRERPERIGDYRILREVGRGGMGVVYEAEQVSLSRRVALKVLPIHAVGDGTSLRRFRREAKSAGRLHHTNIVPVFEVGDDGEVAFYAMQLIHGQGLDLVIDELRRLRDPDREAAGRGLHADGGGETCEPTALNPLATPSGPGDRELGTVAESLLGGRLPSRGLRSTLDAAPGPPRVARSGAPATEPAAPAMLPGGAHVSELDSGGRRRPYFLSVAQIGRQAAEGLAHAHARGIVHRDIKPSNLLLDTAGVVWITDFGLAKDEDDGLTAPGDILGTLRYMAPERFRGEGDARADIYALGMTLYELLTLRPAYSSLDRLRLIERIKAEEPPGPRSIDGRIPMDLETIVLKAIDKQPSRRYQSAQEMGEDLRRFLADEPILARPVGPAERFGRWARRNPTIAGLVVALAGVLVLATAASLLVAGRYAGMADRERASARAERRSHGEAEAARVAAQAEAGRATRSALEAVAERRRADATIADMFTSRGLLAGERDANAEAALWFAAAAEQSADAEDEHRAGANRLRARNWLRRATLPVAATSVPGIPSQVDFQPGGDLLLVRCHEGGVGLWSWREGRRLPWAEGLGGVRCARFAPDGASLALGFQTGEAQIRASLGGEILAGIPHPGPLTALAFSPDGRYLAVGGEHARVWEVAARAFLGPALVHPGPVTGLAFNRAGDRLITACADRRSRVFAVGGGPPGDAPLFAPLPHASASVPALVDGDRALVTVSADSELTRWEMASGARSGGPIRVKTPGLRGVVASPDGRWLAAAAANGTELHAADLGRPPAYLPHSNEVIGLAFSPDGSSLLTGSRDSTARLWSVPGGRPLAPPLGHLAGVEGCAWSGDSSHLATSQYDGLVRVWSRPAGDPVIARESGWGHRPRMSPDGRLAVPGIWHEAAGGSPDQGVVRLRALSTADGRAAGADIPLPGRLVDSCVTGDNLAVAAGCSVGKEGRLGVWDVATARARFEPIPLPGLPLSVAARPGAGQVAVLCATGDLLVIDDRTGRRALELCHEAWAGAERSARVQYTADGATLVSLSGWFPATINARDADSGRLRYAPLRPDEAGANFHAFTLSADGRLLATTALVKNAVRVWDLATGRPLPEPLPHPGDFWGIFSVRFGPEGRHVLTGHKDGQARYWDWRAGKLACPPMAHDDEVPDVAVTPDGRFALTVVRNRPELHAWELATGRRIGPIARAGVAEGGWQATLAVTPDGRRALVSYSGDDLAVVDLDALLTPPAVPTADLRRLAELAASQRIELGELSGLTTDQWRERWERLRSRYPDLAPPGIRRDRRPGAVGP